MSTGVFRQYWMPQQLPKPLNPTVTNFTPAPGTPNKAVMARADAYDVWRGQNLAKNFAFFSDELIIVPPPPLNAAYVRDNPPWQVFRANVLPPPPAVVADKPTYGPSVARNPIEVRFNYSGSAITGNAAIFSSPAVPPTQTGQLPNISVKVNSGTYNYDLSLYFSGATSYSIAPSVATGWAFNTSTAVLTVDSGADAAGTYGPYTVTAINSGGNVSGNAFSVKLSNSKISIDTRDYDD